MSGHALLSPSSAARWLQCTPSARLESNFEDKAGDAAEEGTLAHTLGELLLRYKTKRVAKVPYTRELKIIEGNRFYDGAMLEYADGYATYVLECLAEAQSHTSDAQLFLETKLDLTAYIPDGFGTGDAIIIANHVLNIIDLKYGKGVPVSAEQNRQMMLYALGALKEYDFLFDIHIVRMTIYQPRLDSISTWEIPVDELINWAETELVPRAKLAYEGKGEYKPGAHCRFCKAKGLCKANAEHNMEMAKYDFKQEALLNDKEVADILDRADDFKKWIAGIEEYALSEAVQNGKKWPGYKLVEGRSNRMISDPAKAAEILLKQGIAEDKIYSPKVLLGIGGLEKAVGKNELSTYLSELIIKPQGKATLVPDSDKRPELNSIESAQADFAA